MTDVEMHDETEVGPLHLDGTVILDVADRQVKRGEQARTTTARDHRDPVGDVAVLLPCRDEEVTIAKVVSDFRSALPAATIYVYDNASTDNTAAAAAAAGAIVRLSPDPGKGSVLRRMFAEVDAAVYVLADGDDTYDASAAPSMVDRLHRRRLDMVVGRRVDVGDDAGIYRLGHRFGNRLLTWAVHRLFGGGCADMLSGYRVFSRRYVKSFAASSTGFEIETEMTIHALDLDLPFEEVPVEYQERPADSESKLRTIPDGIRILWFALRLCKDYRPLRFFGSLAVTATAGAVGVGVVAPDSLRSRTPATLVVAALAGGAVLGTSTGVILDSLRRNRLAMMRMLYLATSPSWQFEVDRHAWSDAPLDP